MDTGSNTSSNTATGDRNPYLGVSPDDELAVPDDIFRDALNAASSGCHYYRMADRTRTYNGTGPQLKQQLDTFAEPREDRNEWNVEFYDENWGVGVYATSNYEPVLYLGSSTPVELEGAYGSVVGRFEDWDVDELYAFLFHQTDSGEQ